MSEHEKCYPVWQGYGKHLQMAIENAWEKAKADGAESGTYVVQTIAIEAENPIHGYIVVIGPGG
jgi:hypothetical protein